ncbi:hypothetical protein E2C01_051977 [Portunus trituberculatus]|uniref:Secreted protein n=1 Tax=Portunus trituberculatus TaxID=210409 RepID=A0A5B7GKR4_PORTR|nr:hypothetical protein [Portunus trituberculatus]
MLLFFCFVFFVLYRSSRSKGLALERYRATCNIKIKIKAIAYAYLCVLDSVHYAGDRLATGASWTSEIPNFLVDAGIPSLDEEPLLSVALLHPVTMPS